MGKHVLELVRFVDDLVDSGKIAKYHLIIPSGRRLWKWARSIFYPSLLRDGDSPADYDGPVFPMRKDRFGNDPDHLKSGGNVRYFFKFIHDTAQWLRSQESAYGFRVACATMTVAVIAFLQDTQIFFIRQRLVWSMIMINLSMSPTAGQSISSFVLRLTGTFCAMVTTILIWYIGGQTAPGAITLFFFVISGFFYVSFKFPSLRVICMLAILTTTLIIGYELQVQRLGKEVATSQGQPYYPIYLLAPYRLATTSGGIAVAFFWTIFPFAISEHTILRQGLGASLYLLALYNSLEGEIHTEKRVDQGNDLKVHVRSLQDVEKTRRKIHSKSYSVLRDLKTMMGYLRWEIPLIGRFPRGQYEAIISKIERCVGLTTVPNYD